MIILYSITPLVQVFCLQFSSLTIIYFIFGVRSGSLTLLVPMSANCRPPSHHYILCILHFSPFLTKYILLAMCTVCLVSLPLLAMHIADLISRQSKELPLEPCLDLHSTIHELTSWNVLKPFLKCMLHCTHFLHYIVKLVLEHVYHDQLVHLDSKLYMLLYFFQCLENLANRES